MKGEKRRKKERRRGRRRREEEEEGIKPKRYGNYFEYGFCMDHMEFKA